MGPTPPILLASLLDIFLDYAWIWAGALVVLAVAVGVFRFFFLVRLPLWVLTHTLYRVRVHGLENLPKTGPALLVCNHTSFIDALLILAAQPRRVRFVIWAPFTGVPGLRVILWLARVIPIDSRAGPRAIIHSLRTASDALTAGELVCIFAEGGITRTGFLLPFARGFEQIVKRSPVPIIPVCEDHVWGSIFSYQGGSAFWKLPKQLPYVVHVNFGTPLPPTADAFNVRQAIQKMFADSAVRRAAERKPVHCQFVRMAVRHPFRTCIIDPTNTARPVFKYYHALGGVRILMRRLRPIVGDDAMVGVWMPPTAPAALANIALACMGKTSVNLNYTSAPSIVQSAIRQCNIRKVLTSRLFLHKCPLDPGPGVELVYFEDFRKTIGRWEQIRTIAAIWLLPGFIHEYWLMGLGKHSDRDLATVIFSSGSTGDPKGVMLTHGNIAANAESVIQAIDPLPKDRILGILPFFHSFGYTVTLWLPLQVGAASAYHVNPLQAREIGELCRTNGCTIFVATPTFLRSYLRRCEPADFASLRILVCGAEKLPPPLAKEFKDKFGVLPLEGYGCTELSPVATVNVPDWQQGSQRQVGNKSGTIGQPLPGVAARVVHRETRQPVPLGNEGLLLIYGANVMKGYLGRDDLTQKKLLDGWYITGDLARMDEDGFITITGREERFAKVGGEMVPLEKVEDEIQEIIGGSEKACAVTAIPDRAKGERLIVLHVVLPEGVSVQDVWKKLNDKGLPNIYVPSQRDFRQVTNLPILGSGKLDLRKCKEMAMELAGVAAE